MPVSKNRLVGLCATLLALCALSIASCFAAVETVDDSSFKKEVEESSLPVFIDFYADWCGPCKKVSPLIDELATEYGGKIKFVRVNVDKAQKTAERFDANQLPMLVMLSKKVSKGVSITGYHSKEELKSFLDSSLKKVQ